MSVTVVCGRLARAGQTAALLNAMLAAAHHRTRRQNPRVRIFQSVRNPRCLLYVGEWTSRDEYLTSRHPSVPDLDALCERPPERWYCRVETHFERMFEPVQVASCTIFELPQDSLEYTLTHLRERAGPAIRALPECVLRVIYQEEDRPQRLLVLNGWRAPSGEAAYRALAPQLEAPLLERGVHIERCHGRTCGEVERRYSA
jgi:hypothetical protein